MMTTNTSSAKAEGTPDIGTAIDLLNRAWSQVELINMAAEAGVVVGEAGNAIAYGCISVQEILDKVKVHLDPREAEGGGA